MADQDRSRDNQFDDNAKNANSQRNTSGGMSGSSSSRDQSRNRDQNDKSSMGEPDDVAEDRNLSGSSTWLTLPDQQPSGDQSTDESSSSSNSSGSSSDLGRGESNR